MSKGNMRIYYDEEGDYLEIFIGGPKPNYGEDISAGVTVFKDEDILNLKIPLLSSSVQNKISGKIQESFKLRKESKEFLEKAKKMVEDEIEKEAKIK